MCQTRYAKAKVNGKIIRMDKCMVGLIEKYNSKNDFIPKFTTLACCCGHNRYKTTLVLRTRGGTIFEAYSKKIIPRKKRFYKKDSDGFY